jgi:1-acyl-sn-glycerol-3-phosphate acyltransferase
MTDPVPPAIGRRGGAITRMVGRLMLRLVGWKIEGSLPNRPKIVAVVAPHSSNLDFIIAIGLVFSWNLRVRYIGKKELFRFPMGPIMRWLGGIPVDRRNSAGLLNQVVDEFDRSESILLGIAAEGTRKFGARWKTGFYWIAKRAGAVVLPVYLDWSRKVIGILAPVDPAQGEPAADLTAIVHALSAFPRKDGRLIDPAKALATE